jgi:hypothetical protein
VNECEHGFDRAYLLNAEAPELLSAAAAKIESLEGENRRLKDCIWSLMIERLTDQDDDGKVLSCGECEAVIEGTRDDGLVGDADMIALKHDAGCLTGRIFAEALATATEGKE